MDKRMLKITITQLRQIALFAVSQARDKQRDYRPH